MLFCKQIILYQILSKFCFNEMIFAVEKILLKKGPWRSSKNGPFKFVIVLLNLQFLVKFQNVIEHRR